jgi:tRNA-intron endonuclease, archaea type
MKNTEGILIDDYVICEFNDYANELYSKSRFGFINDEKYLQLTLYEATYLFEKGNLKIFDKKKKEINLPFLLKKAAKFEKMFWTKYCVFKDLRKVGYIVKTALKFGADFRVYDKGIKPGEDHAKWIVYPVKEGDSMTWYEFSAKNRVAHSTKKKLLIGVVDGEGDVTYYEINWKRP